MELKLKIYDKKKIEKVYTADTIDCSFGVIEDIIEALNFESIKSGDKKEIAGIMLRCSAQIKPFLKDIFDGLTDEELRRTKTSDVIDVFKGVYDYVVRELGLMAGNQKN